MDDGGEAPDDENRGDGGDAGDDDEEEEEDEAAEDDEGDHRPSSTTTMLNIDCFPDNLHLDYCYEGVADEDDYDCVVERKSWRYCSTPLPLPPPPPRPRRQSCDPSSAPSAVVVVRPVARTWR